MAILVKEPKELARDVLRHRDDLVVRLEGVNHAHDVGVVELPLDLALGPQGLQLPLAVPHLGAGSGEGMRGDEPLG